MLVALNQAFVDIAFIELSVAHQGDHASRVGLDHLAMRDQIILHQAGKGSDCDAQADRAGREVDGNFVLGPAGIALRSAEAPKPLQLVERLIAQEVLDRMEHRARMRLYGDFVLRAQRMKI